MIRRTALVALGVGIGGLLYKLVPSRNEQPTNSEKSQYPIIYLEGNIGAGKSTLAARLAQSTKFNALTEPVREWQNVGGHNLLKLLYADRAVWNFPFQVLALTTLGRRQMEWLDSNPAEFVIMERSPKCSLKVFAQYLADAKMLQPEHMAVLQVLYDTVAPPTDNPVHYIYVRTPPKETYERMTKRGRTEELPITKDYLQELHNLTDQWLLRNESRPVHIIDGRQSPDEVYKAALDIIHQITTKPWTNQGIKTVPDSLKNEIKTETPQQ